MKTTFLHISDFHIRSGDPYDRDVVLRALVASVAEYRRSGRAPELIFATGDVAHGGKAAEYAIATPFFDALLAAAGLERRHLFVIPGNHDVDREMGFGLARTLDSRDDADAYFRADLPKPHLTQKLGAFVDWHDSYFAGIRAFPERSTCGPVEAVDVGGGRLGVLCMNSAMFCQDDNDHAKLCVGRRCLDGATEALRDLKADLNVALIHHPLDWLSDTERANIKASLQADVDLILRGHLHETDVEGVVSVHGSVLNIAAGAAYQTRRWPNRALYVTVDGNDVRVFPVRYEDSPSEVWTVDPSVFPHDPGYERCFPMSRAEDAPAGRPAGVLHTAPTPVAVPRYRSNVPSRHGLPFVGRDGPIADILTRLDDVKADRVVVLHGQPGVGKSELAREFARRQGDRYPGGTFFVDASSAEVLLDLVRVGVNHLDLEFPPGLSLRDQCEQSLLALGGAATLLIYDNVRSVADIERWLPPAGMPCHVLITTLADLAVSGWSCVEVCPLSSDQSLDLIEQLAGPEVTDRYGVELDRLAAGLPIQICPTAVTLAYEARRGRLMTATLDVAHEARKSFALAYANLASNARLLLHAAAFLNCQRIPVPELYRHVAEATEWGEGEYQGLLDGCRDLHLLEGDTDLRIHQLFAAFVLQTPLPADDAVLLGLIREAQRSRLIRLAREVSKRPADLELASVLTVFPLVPTAWETDGANLATVDGEAVGDALAEIGQYDSARPWYEWAVARLEQADVHGRVDHGSLGRNLHQAGYCLSAVGKYLEARHWYERAVAEFEQAYVQGHGDHRSLGRSLNQVGHCLSAMGRYDEARPWYERAVAEKEQGDVNGRVDHVSLGRSVGQVGFCFSAIGHYDEARPWYERAVEEKKQGNVNGRVNHASLGNGLHQVGYCLSAMGEYDEARPWYEQAVAEKQLGDDHGRVDHDSLGSSLRQVGFCLSAVGKFDEAQSWYERAVAEKELGDVHGRVDHASIGRCLHQVAYCLIEVGRNEEAQPWYERAVVESEQGDVHGRVDHASLGRSLLMVGSGLSATGNDNEARRWFERAVSESEQGDVHGRVDQDSLGNCLRAGAHCLRRIGDVDTAMEWERRASELVP